MKYRYLKKSYIIITIYLAIIALIGFSIILLSLDRIECDIISEFQSFAQKTFGIQFFSALSYLGDFYLWVIFSTVFFFYSHLKSRENLSTAIELAVYLILVTASTYFLKVAFARPRPSCIDIVIYAPEASLSYPSGHVSRATGAFMILSRKRSVINTILLVLAVFLSSLSRIVLGVHFPTDILGALFLAFAMRKTTKIIVQKYFKEF